MTLKRYNDFVARAANGYIMSQPFWDESNTATTSTVRTSQAAAIQRLGYSKVLPSLPSGVTAYMVTQIFGSNSTFAGACLVAKLINFGSLDISTPSFTDGNQMPTVTTLGQSRQLASAVLMEVTTVLNATPGNFTITYVDQDGNSSETSASTALTASATVKSVGWVPLNSPDWGARDITTATRTGGTTPTGVIKFWGVIPIAMWNITPASNGVFTGENLMTSGVNIPRLGAADEIGLFGFSTTARGVFGQMVIIGDD